MKRPTDAERRRWYAKARQLDDQTDDGYRIGRFSDWGWTFAGGQDPEPGERNRHSPHRSLDAIADSLPEMQQGLRKGDADAALIAATETAEFWRVVGHEVHDLPESYPGRAFLLRVAESGNVLGSRGRLSPMRARWIWREFVMRAGLPDPEPHWSPEARQRREECREEGEAAPAPAPVRQLSREEIARLQYTPPVKKSKATELATYTPRNKL